MVTRNEIELANRRGERMRSEFPHAVSARYDRQHRKVVIELSSKLTLSFSPDDAQGLENARPSQLEKIELSPSGFGIHFPRLDADLYIPGLLEGLMGSEKWMAARLGRIGGQSQSKAKKAAARANGRLGGRPKRAAAMAGDYEPRSCDSPLKGKLANRKTTKAQKQKPPAFADG